ncbi:hypothetical protein, partial [uncultured Anaerotruncus sp.]|uniref:hypothetical protein n=1 Tax=uncultured Anaerotruncus sp. TaxID=905011 RepID=UPI00267095EF
SLTMTKTMIKKSLRAYISWTPSKLLVQASTTRRRPRAPWNQSFRPPFPKRRRGQGAEPLDAPAGAEHPILRSDFLVLFSRKKE